MRTTSLSSTACPVGYRDLTNGAFDVFANEVQLHFNSASRDDLFYASVSGDEIYREYLASFRDPALRQHHTCHCCRDFFRKYGNLVVVGADGTVRSAIWPAYSYSSMYQPFLNGVKILLARATVTGVYIDSQRMLGTREAYGWTHFGLASKAKDRLTRNAEAEAVSIREGVKVVRQAINEIDPVALDTVITLAETKSIPNTVAAFRDLSEFRAILRAVNVGGKSEAKRTSLIFKLLRRAPASVRNIRSSAAYTLVQEIDSLGLPKAVNRYSKMVDPLNYQRPKAAPKAGNIAAGDKAIQQLGLTNSFRRRFAKMSDVKKRWVPSTAFAPMPQRATTSGLFGAALQPPHASVRDTVIPRSAAKRITWSKFEKTILPSARQIELETKASMNFGAFVAAADPTAPSLFSWDNALSWYVYPNGSSAVDWGLRPSTYVKVKAVVDNPSNLEKFKDQRILVLDGCRDRNKSGLSLFPELLRNDLYPYRSTIEAFSRNKALESVPSGTQTVSGVIVGDEVTALIVRVTSDAGVAYYEIDQYD